MKKDKMLLWLKTDSSVDIQIPNEIFEDFAQAEFKSFNHKCFAYAYYYLITYLYRNVLYGFSTEQYSQQQIVNIFTSNKSSVSYITKSGGLLDQIQYTNTTTNYPIAFYMEEGVLEFGLVKEFRKKLGSVGLDHSPSLSVKEPLKAMTRFDDEEYTGTFYSFQNTHAIKCERFATIVSDEKLGHVGLFVYGYISMMCDRFKNKYQITNAELGKIVGCSESTMKKYTRRLEELNLLKSTRVIHDNKHLSKIYSVV